MKRLVLTKPGHMALEEVDFDQTINPDEALVKVHRVGVCGTDIHAYGGKQPFFSYPRVLGHELGVEVLAVGNEVTQVKPGDRCSLEPYFNIKEGQASRIGKTNCNEFISVFGVHEDGGMQELIKVSAKYLHPSSKMSFDQLALVETLAIGYHAVQRANLSVLDKVLVIGAGPIGLAALQFIAITKAQTVVMDINQDRLDFCTSFGISGTINLSKDQAEAKIKDFFSGAFPTVVFDATGNDQSMMSSFDYVAHGGKLVFIGLVQGNITFHDPTFHKKELTLLASRNALSKDFDEIIALVEQGRVDTDPWITHRAKLEEVVECFESWTNPQSKVVKAMIEMN